jgi:hypothetical protein
MIAARAVLDRWVQHVNTGELDNILALYSEHATLLPTFSSGRLRTPEERRRYFVALAGRPQLQVVVRENSVTVYPVSETAAVIVGLYTFQFELDQQLMNFESRFTFVVDTAAAAPILHHHSSQIPRGLS